jgi:hypothetical protein
MSGTDWSELERLELALRIVAGIDEEETDDRALREQLERERDRFMKGVELISQKHLRADFLEQHGLLSRAGAERAREELVREARAFTLSRADELVSLWQRHLGDRDMDEWFEAARWPQPRTEEPVPAEAAG